MIFGAEGRAKPTVQTRQGPVLGYLDRGVWAFLGVPYAASPLGADRMREPRRPARRGRVFNATSFGPTAPRGEYPQRFRALYPEVKITGEDFLNLNVWTPDPGTAGLPVLVWIHGGSFAYGSSANSEYRGSAFARDGVVLVSVNYRLGTEGFVYTEDGVANLGLLDQIAALEWVRDNIEAFGGDPAKVTLAGHSAGGICVSTLLGMPRAKGLFRGVISMAGACHHVVGPELGAVVARHVADQLGVEPTAAALREVPLDEATEAASKVSAMLVEDPDPEVWGKLVLDILPFEPTVDGTVLPRPPLEAIADGQGKDVALLVGCNADEGRLFFVPNGESEAIDDAALADLAAGYGLGAEGVDAYRRGRPEATPGDLAALIIGDWFYRVPGIRLAEAHQGGTGGTWMYSWDWWSDACDGKLGSAHGVEWAFVFDCLDVEAARLRVGDDPPQAVADATHATWVRFATDVDPGWASYDASSRATGVISDSVVTVKDPRGEERLAWDGIR